MFTDKELNKMFYVVDKRGRKIRLSKEKKQGVNLQQQRTLRVADLAAFYAANAEREVSPFKAIVIPTGGMARWIENLVV